MLKNQQTPQRVQTVRNLVLRTEFALIVDFMLAVR